MHSCKRLKALYNRQLVSCDGATIIIQMFLLTWTFFAILFAGRVMEGELSGGVSGLSAMIITLVTLVSSLTPFFFLCLLGKLNFMVS